MENIYDEIFEFLFEKYLEARAKGEEFYFRIWQSSNTEYKNYLIVSFWDTKDTSINIDLWVNIKNSECYLYISNNWHPIRFSDYKDFDQKEEKIENIKREIYKNIAKRVKKQPKEALGYSQESFVKKNSLKSYKKDTILKSIQSFLEKDKIEIDNYLREKEYNYFWDGTRFIDYVFGVKKTFFLRNKSTFDTGLPSCIRRFTFWDYKAIKHLSIDNIPATTRWIFLTGENGIGKTLVLEAIALSLQLAEWQLSINKSTQVLAIEYQTDVQMVDSYNSLLGSPPNDIPVAAYGCNRFNEVENPENSGISHLFDKRSLIDIDLWLNELLQKIKSNEQGILSDEAQLAKDKYTFNILLACFQRILAIHNIRLDDNNETVLYEETDENGEIISAVPFAALSAGYKNILCITADMIVQLSHVWLPTHTKSYEIQAPKDLTGIVIIDEFENHLHAKFQRKWVEILTGLFPKVQFIVSTHSPIPLLGAPKESVILHVERSKEEGITVVELDVDWENFTPDILFSSPIFGFKNIIPKSHNKDLGIRTEYTYDETLLNDEVARRIKERADEYESIFDN